MNPGVFLAGALLGAGILLLLRAALSPAEPLETALSRLHHGKPPSNNHAGQVAVELLAGLGVNLDRHAQALRLCARTAADHALRKIGGAMIGIAIAAAVALATAATGTPFPAAMLLMVLVASAVAGFAFPDLRLREQAKVARRDARHATASYLDLVRVLVASGSDIRGALVVAADAGDGPMFSELRASLDRSTARSEPAWRHLATLADDLGVDELADLAATVQLVATDGTNPTAALTGKADAMRSAELAATRAELAAATERMVLPISLIALAFAVYLAYPALMTLISARH